MKKILILGAGLVSRPGVSYLLSNKDFFVTVADKVVLNAQKLVMGHENGKAVSLDVSDGSGLEKLIRENDVVVSLLPWTFHIKVARIALENGKSMVTASYVSEEMKKLDPEVRAKGLIFLNEVGVDPGIDHMSAMKIIDDVHSGGGEIREFYSYCGGLPAPEDNNNPLGYKFSWSPKGVILAAKNPARFLKDNKIVEIKGEDLFLNCVKERVEGLGMFEVYPNRDSLPYRKLYGIEEAETVIRGTYRNIGWCETFKKIADIGLLDETTRDDLIGKSYRRVMADLAGESDTRDIEWKVASKLGVDKDSSVMSRLKWIGLFSEETVKESDNYLDLLGKLLLKKMRYERGEKDMLILQHRFVVRNSDGSYDRITSTMIDYGIPGGDSSMARTVSLPLAISVTLIAEGKINLTGVRIPNVKEIYEPVLLELKRFGIEMKEKRSGIF